jgi:hypothetical protein
VLQQRGFRVEFVASTACALTHQCGLLNAKPQSIRNECRASSTRLPRPLHSKATCSHH